MPTYSLRCGSCGDFDLIAAMSQRPDRATCPVCGQLRARVISSPLLHTASTSLDTAVERAGRSAESPEVIRSIPASGSTALPSARDRRYPPLPRS